MSVLAEYEPRKVLSYFEALCNIPHGSGNTKAISDYLVQFAKEHSLRYRQDEKNNVIIWKDGCGKSASHPPVIIQGHMDMVAVKTFDCDKNMDTDGLDLEIINVNSEDYISANGTSLGGDDGIAVAYALAVLEENNIDCPPIEAVFTVDEEVGMLGAAALDTSDLAGKMLLNIDSEDEGVFTVSCAGGAGNVCHIPGKKESINDKTFILKLDGLRGGHSGVDINEGRLNAISALGRILQSVKDDIRIVELSGGEKDNAIARFAEATIVIVSQNESEIVDRINAAADKLKMEYATIEDAFSFNVSPNSSSYEAFDKESSCRMINALSCLPNGVIRMNPDVEGMVQTSLNLGILETIDDEIVVTAMLRSSVDSEKEYLSKQVKTIIEMCGGYVKEEGVYPGWAYKADSKLREIMIEVYKEQYGKMPVVEGIHAGLECGLFADKIDGLDCISFGPQIDDIHTTSEKLSISSVERTWNLIKFVLAKL